MTHAQLVERAGKWLRAQGCSIAFEELTTSTVSEIPDAIGWRDGGRLSYLIECKASRGDFLADKRKASRMGKGMGTYRYYMCPPGLIHVEELPERWGLLYCHPTRITVEAGRHPRRWDAESMSRYYHAADRVGEIALVCSALHRLQLDLGAERWRERVHLSYSERQAQEPRRFVFLD